MAYGHIDEQSLREARALIGVPLRTRWWNEYATKDAVRQFVQGIGDPNPLWQDDEYARKTRWGQILAPQTFVYGVIPGGGVRPSFPGVQSFHAGDRLDCFDVIREGTRFTVDARVEDIREKRGRMAGQIIFQVIRMAYGDYATGKPLVTLRRSIARVDREQVSVHGKYKPRQPHRYTKEDLRRIEAAYDAEVIRGSTPRYWEDVTEGEDLPPVVKGPLNLTDMLGFYAGAMGAEYYGGVHGNYLRYRRRHSGDVYYHAETGVPTPWGSAHHDAAFSPNVGMPGLYDLGNQRISWIVHMLTNWMGDDGFLKSIDVQIRLPSILGDTSWCRGKVIKKWREGSEHLIECQGWAENQLGEVTAPGTAVVRLPSRANTGA